MSRRQRERRRQRRLSAASSRGGGRSALPDPAAGLPRFLGQAVFGALVLSLFGPQLTAAGWMLVSSLGLAWIMHSFTSRVDRGQGRPSGPRFTRRGSAVLPPRPGGAEAARRPPTPEAPDPEGIEFLLAAGSDVQCQFCGAGVPPGAEVACSHCETPHHPDCWEENEGCTTYGCAGERRAAGFRVGR